MSPKRKLEEEPAEKKPAEESRLFDKDGDSDSDSHIHSSGTQQTMQTEGDVVKITLTIRVGGEFYVRRTVDELRFLHRNQLRYGRNEVLTHHVTLNLIFSNVTAASYFEIIDFITRKMTYIHSLNIRLKKGVVQDSLDLNMYYWTHLQLQTLTFTLDSGKLNVSDIHGQFLQSVILTANDGVCLDTGAYDSSDPDNGKVPFCPSLEKLTLNSPFSVEIKRCAVLLERSTKLELTVKSGNDAEIHPESVMDLGKETPPEVARRICDDGSIVLSY